MPVVTGGRYGLSSKEFTPGMVAGVFADLAAAHPKPRFTVGITDDVSGISLDYAELDIEPASTVRAVFYGLGSDGTVGANKNTIKILGADRGLHAQGYFVYDSKKSGSQTVSHLRFGPGPIHAPYLVLNASFVGCHQAELIERTDVLCRAAPGATLLLNSPRPAGEVWDSLPRPVQEQILAKGITLYAIDASQVARDAGLPGRINTVLQTCFFAISGVLPREEAIAAIKAAIAKTYGRRGPEVVARNNAAVDQALAALHQIPVPGRVTTTRGLPALVPADAPDFVRQVTAEMMAGRGDALPVSALPVDGTYPSGTTAFEKRNISDLVAEWDPDLCIQCGNCSFVCPHSVIRAKFFDESALAGAPDGFKSMPLDARGLPDTRYSLQVYAEDCTGCALCIEACPVRAPGEPGGAPSTWPHESPWSSRPGATSRSSKTLPVNDRSRVDFGTVRGTQFLQPLFEFSGACAGCGETPYLKLLSQLFGDRLMIANATGLLVDLRRQPAHHAVDGQRRGPRPGLVQLAVRGQRRVRARLPAGRRPAPAAGPRPAGPAPGAARPGPGGRDPGRAAAPGVGAGRAAGPGRRTDRPPGRAGHRRSAGRRPAQRGWTTWSGAASGWSAGTAGPTTSARAAWTTCWPAGAT